MRCLVRTLVAVLLIAGSTAPAGPSTAGGTEPVGVWPLRPDPDVVRPFEPPPTPWAAGHRGVDLAGRPGQVVHAAVDGTVGFVGSIGGKPVVTVVHGGRRTTYEPVVGAVVGGQQVSAGEALGRLVVTDSHCFPAACLHWGLIRGEEYLDPLTLVGSGPVRLLPLWREDPVTARLPWTARLEAWRPPAGGIRHPGAHPGGTRHRMCCDGRRVPPPPTVRPRTLAAPDIRCAVTNVVCRHPRSPAPPVRAAADLAPRPFAPRPPAPPARDATLAQARGWAWW